MNDFFRGVSYFFSGFGFIFKPKIRKYVFVPLFVNIILFSIAIWFAIYQTQEFVISIANWWSWLEWLQWLIWPLFIFAMLVFVFFTFSILANLIAAPFNGFLAEAVELYLSDKDMVLPSRSITMEIITAITSELSKLLYYATRAIPVLLLSFIPGMQFLWLLFGAWMLALQYIDFPMANHGMKFKQERLLIKQKRWLALGFGSMTMLMAMIPLLNFIVMPVAVCAATNIWVKEYKKITIAS